MTQIPAGWRDLRLMQIMAEFASPPRDDRHAVRLRSPAQRPERRPLVSHDLSPSQQNELFFRLPPAGAYAQRNSRSTIEMFAPVDLLKAEYDNCYNSHLLS